jgi:hypothetical protein
MTILTSSPQQSPANLDHESAHKNSLWRPSQTDTGLYPAMLPLGLGPFLLEPNAPYSTSANGHTAMWPAILDTPWCRIGHTRSLPRL